MLTRIQKKFVLSFTSYWAFSITFYQFLLIYKFEHKSIGFVSVALLSLTALLIPSKLLRYPTYIVSFLGGLYVLIPMSQVTFSSWLETFYTKLIEASQIFVSGRANFLPHELAVFLLLFTTLVLIELVVEYQQVWLSTVFLVGYLLILAIYNRQDFYFPLVLVLSISLFQQYYLKNQKMPQEKSNHVVYILLLLVLSLGALNLPKEKIERPLLSVSGSFRNWLNDKGVYHFIEKQGLPQASRTGFSENDEQLGGPIFDDNQLVFEALQKNAHYWRVESKSIYTGEGWQKSPSENSQPERTMNELTLTTLDYQQRLDPPEEIQLTFSGDERYIPLPYGRVTLALQTDTPIELAHSIRSGRVNTEDSLKDISVQMDWQNLDYTVDDLALVPLELPRGSVDYLQLPESFPASIRQLAEEIVEGKLSLIGQVQAIEDYLKSNDLFRYSKIDATYPEKGKDFVSHFLFESHVGYCDHFSTSMTVMLRSIGIPVRWVKGFASGTPVSIEEEGTRYAVRNNDAHSWVEVYFEGYGWLPFEPTPSFLQPLQEDVSEDVTELPLITESTESVATEESNETVEQSSQVSVSKEDSSEVKTSVDKNKEISIRKVVSYLVAGLLIALIVVFVLYLRRWFVYLTILLLLKLKKQPFEWAYRFLLNRLGRRSKRVENQSLADYAILIEQLIPNLNQKFIELTKEYERYLYDRKTRLSKEQIKLIKAVAKALSNGKNEIEI